MDGSIECDGDVGVAAFALAECVCELCCVASAQELSCRSFGRFGTVLLFVIYDAH